MTQKRRQLGMIDTRNIALLVSKLLAASLERSSRFIISMRPSLTSSIFGDSPVSSTQDDAVAARYRRRLPGPRAQDCIPFIILRCQLVRSFRMMRRYPGAGGSGGGGRGRGDATEKASGLHRQPSGRRRLGCLRHVRDGGSGGSTTGWFRSFVASAATCFHTALSSYRAGDDCVICSARRINAPPSHHRGRGLIDGNFDVSRRTLGDS